MTHIQQGIHRRQYQFGNLRPLCYNFYENQQSTTEIGKQKSIFKFVPHALIGLDRQRKLNCSGDVQSIDAARAWNNEYSLEGKNQPEFFKNF